MIKQTINVLSIDAFGLSFGGDETRLLNQSRLLNQETFKCIICTPKSSAANMTSHFKSANVKLIYFKILPFRLKSFSAPIRMVLITINFLMYAMQLIRIIYREKIDVIDGRLLGGGIYGLILKKITRLPVMVTLYHKSELKRLAKRCCIHLLGTSDAVICDSKMRSDELRHWIGSDKPKFFVIPSAIELKFSIDKEMEDIRKEKAMSGKIIISQIAGIVPFKGQDLLIDAFHVITKNHNNVELWIVGYPRNVDYYNLLIKQAKDLNISDKVRFICYPGYIGNVFKTIDIQVHASRFDSLPNSILEGMSVGKPLIACEVGGIPEAVIHGQTGLLFEIDNLQALINCLDQLINDPEYRFRLGMAAWERFEKQYSPILLIKQLEEAIIKTANQH